MATKDTPDRLSQLSEEKRKLLQKRLERARLESLSAQAVDARSSPRRQHGEPSPHAGAESRSPLVALQASGSASPFFCMHPVGGNVFCYFELARQLGGEQPVYGLRARGINEHEEPLERLEEMAAYYNSAIRQLQPHGPYLLGGWSLGGILSFEMARQLRQQDEQVALVALIDSYAPIAEIDYRVAESSDAHLLLKYMREVGGELGQELSASFENLQQIPEDDQLAFILEQAHAQRVLPPFISLAEVRRLLRVFRSNRKAVEVYLPQSYAGAVELFRAVDEVNEFSDEPTLNWNRYVTKVDVHQIPGNHYSMLTRPHVQALAERLRASLDQAHAAIRAGKN